ncbi:MAG: alpha/beta family hydrolase [Magnetovibrionaceae bacterium]
MTDIELIFDGPETAEITIALAHGAGAPMDSPFMVAFAEGLGAAGFRVARFEFPYMAERRLSGKKKPPDRQPKLLDCWRAVIEALAPPEKLVISGKSMGGRMASIIADDVAPKGLVCLGYPFHSPGKPDKLRIEHLQALKTPTLILQGTRDSLGNAEEVAGYPLAETIRRHWLEDGDHSFKPRKKSGRTEQQNWDEAIAAFAAFVRSLP